MDLKELLKRYLTNVLALPENKAKQSFVSIEKTESSDEHTLAIDADALFDDYIASTVPPDQNKQDFIETAVAKVFSEIDYKLGEGTTQKIDLAFKEQLEAGLSEFYDKQYQ